MKKIFTLFVTLILVIQNSIFYGAQEVFAVTDSYDFSSSWDYTISDSNDSYIHGWAAKLKWSLAHRWHLENGPWATDWATNVVIDWGYAYVTWYWSHAVTSIDISDPTNMSHAGYLGANSVRRLYGAYDLKKVWNYVYAVWYTADALEIIDATDPTNLIHKWRRTNITDTKLNGARWIDVVWNYAYIAAYVDDALQIVDISNPWAPSHVSYIQDATRLDWATSVKVVWNYAYVTSYTNDSVQIIDVSDPLTPTFVGQIVDDAVTELNGAWDIEVVWNYAYVTWYNDDGFEIIDISDPTNPTHVWEIQNSDPSVRLNWARELKIVWNYAYISASVDDNIEIIDITNPAIPLHVWNYDTDNFGILDWVFGIDISGTDMFVTSYNNATIMSFDITLPTTPIHQNTLESWPARLWNPIWIHVEWDYAYVSSYGSNALEIINISDSSNPIHQWAVADHTTNNELWGSWDVSKKWNYVYVSWYGDNWIEVVDVSNPSSPFWVARLLDNSSTIELHNPRGSHIQWNFLYVTAYNGDSLQIIDITNPLVPVARWFLKDSSSLNWAGDVRVQWNYAYVATYINDSITVVDISDPDNPTYVTEIKDAGAYELNWSWNLDIDGDYLYVLWYIDAAIVVIDISDPTNPAYMSDLDDDWTTRLRYPRGIVYDEWYAYISTYSDDWVAVVDVSDPTDLFYIDDISNNDLYDTSTQIDKQNNDIFTTQYLWSSLSVIRESYPTTSPFIIPNNHINSNYFNSLNLTLWAYNEWNVTFQLSKDNWITWYYFNGVAWLPTVSWTAQSNSAAIINANIAGFNVLTWTDEIKWKAFLNSDGTQKVEIDQIEIDYFDNEPPVIDSVSPIQDALLPKHNFDISYTYFDVDGAYWSGSVTENNWWVWIDTSSAVLELYRWNWTNWWADIASTYIDFGATVWTGWVDYPTNNIPYGKYKIDFSIDDLNGNQATESTTFYVDQPEFIVSTPTIDIWALEEWTTKFSDEVTLTVKTVWAWFNLTMNQSSDLSYWISTIIPWDTTSWVWYDPSPYSSTISTISTDQNVATQSSVINTDWNKNTYTYTLKMWALIEHLQNAWDYSWDIDFTIDLDY